MDAKLKIQIDRLHRRYTAAKTKVDFVECLDLAHCLRVWTEIADDQIILGDIGRKRVFRCAKPNNKAAKILHRNNAEYMWLHTADYNHAEIIQIALYMHDPKNLPFNGKSISVASQIFPAENGNPAGIRNFYLGSTVRNLDKKIDTTRNLTLSQFLSSQILTYRFNDKIERFDAKYIIKRTANGILDASHFQSLTDTSNAGRLTEALPIISNASIGTVSMLYFILLYIAQEILIGLDKIERIKPIGKSNKSRSTHI